MRHNFSSNFALGLAVCTYIHSLLRVNIYQKQIDLPLCPSPFKTGFLSEGTIDILL